MSRSIAKNSLKFSSKQKRSALYFGRFTPGEVHTEPTEETQMGQAVGLNILQDNSGPSFCPKSNHYYLAVHISLVTILPELTTLSLNLTIWHCTYDVTQIYADRQTN
jgi:hypothetical protein